MSRNPYIDLCLTVQALRRGFEEIRTPLAPAVGVAAALYTHQIANVLRVLTDVRVRHLLADEVGLGKTVQALMILNALRRQRRDLQALVIVPDRLVPQWRDEIMTRAHTAPCDGEPAAVEGGQFVRLAWQDQLRRRGPDGDPLFALSDIDPTRYQVLVVDELHRLKADVQDRIVRASAHFEHVLVLTATPSFQQPDRHAQLFSLLEPERAARARWQVAQTSRGADEGLIATDDISKWPSWAAQAVVDALLARDREAAARAELAELPAVSLASCAYRRVLRTRREDYTGVLPRRRHLPVCVAPLGAEVDRQSLMWRYFGHLDDLNRDTDRVLLAKRVILSPASLEQRVDWLRRNGHERAGLLEKVKPLVHRSQGDSRADALVDLLAAVWARDPQERVLVAAQDNLTVDYLYKLVQARLPEIGPLRSRTRLFAARIRQGQDTAAVDDLGGFGNETNENLEAFQRGDAQVLFAPDAAHVGLNLQCARVLVLYSVPWAPEEVEQWIGRLDRLGNTAAVSHDGDAKPIDVYTIAQRGAVDEQVVTVLQRFRVFERSVNLDGHHLREVAQRIEDAALRSDAVNWRDLEDASAAMADEDAVQELGSVLRPHLPWNVAWAKAQRQRLDSLPPAPPVLVEETHPPAGPRAWDCALEPMLKLLGRAGDYTLRKTTDRETGLRFRTLWYRFGERGMYGHKPVPAKVVFSFGADPGHERSPEYAHAFITRRGDIGSPPRREVMLALDQGAVRRPLRFLSYGDALHDELIEGWSKQPTTTVALDVIYFDDHALWERAAPGLFVIHISTLDAAVALQPDDILGSTLEGVAAQVKRSAMDRLSGLVAPFTTAATCALEADRRWLRSELTAVVLLEVKCWTSDGWLTVPLETAAALLNPMAHPREGLPQARELVADPNLRSAYNALDHLRASPPLGQDEWSHRLPDFVEALAARVRVVAEEGTDAIALAEQELARAEATVVDCEARGNRAQITRAVNARDAAADVLEMTRAYWRRREDWLHACGVSVRALRPRETLASIIRARRPGH